MKVLSIALVMSLFAGNVMATEQTVAECKTYLGKDLKVTLDKTTDKFTVNYGDYHVVKKSNDMFWHSEHSGTQQVNDTVMYYYDGDEEGVFSITDYGNDYMVSLKVDVDQDTLFSDQCRIKGGPVFDEQAVTANMAWVSNSDQE